MTTDQLRELFKRFMEDDYLCFVDVEPKFSNRPDLHAFVMLDKLLPVEGGVISKSVWKGDNIVESAEHDEIWLSISPDRLAEVVSEFQVRDLIRCGVRYDASVGLLAMFV